MKPKTLIPLLLFILGTRPFGFTLFYLYFILSAFCLLPLIKSYKIKFPQILLLVIFSCVFIQLFLGYPLDLVLLASYFPFLLAPIIYCSFLSGLDNFSVFTLKTFLPFSFYLSCIQLLIQFLQFFSTIFNYDLTFLNALVIPVPDYSASVFVAAGLSMDRYSGVFNQPLDCGLFWFSIFTLYFSSSNLPVYDLSCSDSLASSLFWRRIAPIFALLGCLLSGSKIFLLIVSLLLVRFAQSFLNNLSTLRLSKRNLLFFMFALFVLLPAFLSYVLTQVKNNPLITVFFTTNASFSNYLSFYNLSAGRISESGEILKEDSSVFSVFGSGYHSVIYDNGFLYILKHIGFVGLLSFVIFAFISLVSFRCSPNAFHYSSRLQQILVFLAVMLVTIGGSVLTLHKSSLFFLSTLMYISATRASRFNAS